MIKVYKLLGLFLSIFLYKTMAIAEPSKEPTKVLPSDPWAVSTFSNYPGIISDKKAVLSDLALFIKDSPKHIEKYGNDSQLLSLLIDDQLWPIALGGGYASKLFFDILRNYYENHRDEQTVIYRLMESKNIEYYAVPNSYILVYRNISDSGYYGVGSYNIMTRSPDIWRSSFSIQQPRSSHTTSSLGVDKSHSQDILVVLKFAKTIDAIEKYITVQENWTSYSHLISLDAMKLY